MAVRSRTVSLANLSVGLAVDLHIDLFGHGELDGVGDPRCAEALRGGGHPIGQVDDDVRVEGGDGKLGGTDVGGEQGRVAEVPEPCGQGKASLARPFGKRREVELGPHAVGREVPPAFEEDPAAGRVPPLELVDEEPGDALAADLLPGDELSDPDLITRQVIEDVGDDSVFTFGD